MALTSIVGYGDPDPAKRVSRREREEQKQLLDVRNKVRMQGYKISGAIALGAHAMDGMLDLDQHRRLLAGDDQLTNIMLAQIEEITLRQVMREQRRLFDEWGL